MKLDWIEQEHFVYLDKISEEQGDQLRKRVHSLIDKKLNIAFEAGKSLVGSFEFGSQFFLDQHGTKIFGDIIEAPLRRYFERINIKNSDTLKLYNAWVNVASGSNYNPPHYHHCKYSGVLYLDLDSNTAAEDKEEGKIFFSFGQFNPDALQFNGVKMFKPKALDLVLFPFWQKHFVYPTLKTSEKRISIAFNID